METGDSRTLNCTLVAIDHSNYYYTVCSLCEKTLTPDINNHLINVNNPSSSSVCNHCHSNNPSSSSSAPKRLFRILVSICLNGFMNMYVYQYMLALILVSINFVKHDCDRNVCNFGF